MHFVGIALLAYLATTITAYPHPIPQRLRLTPTWRNPKGGSWRQPFPWQKSASVAMMVAANSTLPISVALSADTTLPANTTLTPRAPKGTCKTLELPTETMFRTGYTQFCNKYVAKGVTTIMGPTTPPLVATFMLETQLKTSIPWIFKIHGMEWGSANYHLTRDKCKEGFKKMLDSERTELGKNFCVVGNSGGEGESKKFSGQGVVLAMGGDFTYRAGFQGDESRYESRKRNGKFEM